MELGLVKIMGISEKSHLLSHKAVESCPNRGCVLWSNGVGWVHCASVKGESSRECMCEW